MTPPVQVKQLGQQDYTTTWQAMQDFTAHRNENTVDEFWVVEHPPVFTLGQAGKPEHVLQAGLIPVIETDRGGQVTYHGPGQLVIYLLLDLRRRKLGIKALVRTIENALVAVLARFGITAHCVADAPGVYVGDKKIAALGLRVRKGCSYHGLSLNVDMKLEPFNRINPCGFEGLEVTQLAEYISSPDISSVTQFLITALKDELDK